MTTERNRLAWQCRRGMRELDVLLNGFLQQHYEALSSGQRETFNRLLAYPDQVLLELLMGRMLPADQEIARLAESIRHSAQA